VRKWLITSKIVRQAVNEMAEMGHGRRSSQGAPSVRSTSTTGNILRQHRDLVHERAAGRPGFRCEALPRRSGPRQGQRKVTTPVTDVERGLDQGQRARAQWGILRHLCPSWVISRHYRTAAVMAGSPQSTDINVGEFYLRCRSPRLLAVM
jgi:hypothetical protein